MSYVGGSPKDWLKNFWRGYLDLRAQVKALFCKHDDVTVLPGVGWFNPGLMTLCNKCGKWDYLEDDDAEHP